MHRVFFKMGEMDLSITNGWRLKTTMVWPIRNPCVVPITTTAFNYDKVFVTKVRKCYEAPVGNPQWTETGYLNFCWHQRGFNCINTFTKSSLLIIFLSSWESKRSKSAPAFPVWASSAHWSHLHGSTSSPHLPFIRLPLLINNSSGTVRPRKYPSSIQEDVETISGVISPDQGCCLSSANTMWST